MVSRIYQVNTDDMHIYTYKYVYILLILINICVFFLGGELQRVAITLCLGTAADIYLIDEPSAYLDSEQRIAASKVYRHYH